MLNALHRALCDIVGTQQVLTRPIDLAAFSSDASVYRLVPVAVVRPRSVNEVQRLFAACRAHHVPMTFRTAGTSLSGQAVTDGVLVDLSRDWRSVEVLDGGRRVRVGPGVVGAAVNARLKPWRAKIGPDPASIQAAMMGGILANNSSGMCCGVAQNAYHTLDSLVFVLPTGTVIDTAAADADESLRRSEPALADGLLALRGNILAQPALAARIRRKYLTKNTTGYSLNAFLDCERPVDILARLLIGSEGTLAFIASAVLQTVADLPVKYTGLLLFPTIHAACSAIGSLRDAGAAAVELMDRAALRSVERQPGIPPVAHLPSDAAGLLVEFQAPEESQRAEIEKAAGQAVAGLDLAEPPRFTHEPAEQAALWKIRQGMFPSVGAARKRGTAVLIEDVAFPVERLAEAVSDLQALFVRHGYDDAIIFGHAKDGNLHFVITQSFNDEPAVERYARLMDDVVALVVRRYDGALKAEHGTGRNIAPFVETEWGPDAYAVMRELKRLVDPDGVLNPGVILTDDPRAHLAHLKSLPAVADEVDACIECGYCEPKCPSRDLTMTPRQRIVVSRQMERLRAAPAGTAALAAIEADFGHDALDTCAADGLCATACPVGIDTGLLTKHLRATRHLPVGHQVARWVARHFATVEKGVRLALGAGGAARALLGDRVLAGVTGVPARLLRRRLPSWLPPMPRSAPNRRPATTPVGAAAVYFPSCVSRTMGALPGEPDDLTLVEAMVRLAARAGQPVWIPNEVDGHCCGVPFSSKGYVDAHRLMINATIERFWHWSDGGRLPVVVDTSPCTYGLLTSRDALSAENRDRLDRLTIVDSVEFAARALLPGLRILRTEPRVVLHPVCSVVKLNLSAHIEQVARACAGEVVVPLEAGCCGFAGDRGWLVPELTASATRREAAEVNAANASGHYSSSRTCEIGMTRATGHVYRSHIFLLEWATRPEEPRG
jgi:D-lactate dehydrogenase